MPTPTIIVHGGAGAIQFFAWELYKQGAHQAALVGQAVLDHGGSALDAAIAAVRHMEDNRVFNAGTGSSLNREGIVECDAFAMRDDRESGAVAGVTGVRNPVLLARVVLERTHHQLIVGTGAEALAREQGIETCDPAEMVVPRRRKRYEEMVAAGMLYEEQFNPEEAHDDPHPEDNGGDTVGACAIDAQGHLAAASSTGGIMLKLPGRAGDTPVIGSGGYCGPAGAISCTGHGESVMRVCLAKHAYDLMAAGTDAAEAAMKSVEHLVDTVKGIAGLVVVDRWGNRGWATSTERIAVGVPEREIDAREGNLPAKQTAP